MIRRCQWCKNGIKAIDNGTPYMLCALNPPSEAGWRPAMKLKGWCGQFKLGFLSLFGYGARA